MLFVQKGREVVPRLVENRTEKAVIVDIKNEMFVIIMKQDRSREIVRVRDIVLTDRVYTTAELDDSSCEFYRRPEPAQPTNDFTRYVDRLRERIESEIIQERGLAN